MIVLQVYVGSFWDQQLKHDLYRRLFERELQALFDDLQDLPKNAATRKLNDFIKRARMAKIHAYIISSLKDSMPKFCGKGAQIYFKGADQCQMEAPQIAFQRYFILTCSKCVKKSLTGRKKKELLRDLPTLFKKIQEEHLVSPSDIPSVTSMQVQKL